MPLRKRLVVQTLVPGTTLELVDRLKLVDTHLQEYLHEADAHEEKPHPDVEAAYKVLGDVLTPVSPAYTYNAVGTRVVDGDTFVAELDLGFRVFYSCMIRLYGVNAPEHNRPGGPAATNFLRQLVEGKPLLVRSHDDDMSFARWVCEVWTNSPGEQQVNVTDSIIAAGHGVPFHKGDHWTP